MLRSAFLWVFFILLLLAGCSEVGESPSPTPTTALPEPGAVDAAPTLTLSPPEALPTATTFIPGDDMKPTEPQPSDPTGLPVELVECSGVLTSANQEGPYYLEGSPEKSNLVEQGMPGTPIVILGGVFDPDCTPIPGAKVDFWQADAEGVYDNAGYRLRGHVLSDANGLYTIRTIEPGLYTGRPPHIHVKVFGPNGREVLTTQIYFPGSEDSTDVRAAPDLLAVYLDSDTGDDRQVLFNFVVQMP